MVQLKHFDAMAWIDSCIQPSILQHVACSYPFVAFVRQNVFYDIAAVMATKQMWSVSSLEHILVYDGLCNKVLDLSNTCMQLMQPGKLESNLLHTNMYHSQWEPCTQASSLNTESALTCAFGTSLLIESPTQRFACSSTESAAILANAHLHTVAISFSSGIGMQAAGNALLLLQSESAALNPSSNLSLRSIWLIGLGLQLSQAAGWLQALSKVANLEMGQQLPCHASVELRNASLLERVVASYTVLHTSKPTTPHMSCLNGSPAALRYVYTHCTTLSVC